MEFNSVLQLLLVIILHLTVDHHSVLDGCPLEHLELKHEYRETSIYCHTLVLKFCIPPQYVARRDTLKSCLSKGNATHKL